MSSGIGSLKNRDALKALFNEGVIPSQRDFEDLIDSVLVKRDDQFFGYHHSGVGYKKDDVVIFDGSLYIYLSKEDAQAAARARNEECDCLDEDDCCGGQDPKHCCRWEQIHIDADDGDWIKMLDHEKNPIGLYASLWATQVGIGTDKPQALLHLNGNTEGGGQLLFNPTDSKNVPLLKMIKAFKTTDSAKIDENCDTDTYTQQAHFVDQSLQHRSAEWLTNAPLGFVFKKLITQDIPARADSTEKTIVTPAMTITEEVFLMLVTSDDSARPRIGIGTDMPHATLDVADANKGHVLINPLSKSDPEIILFNLKSPDKNYLAQSINNSYAVLSTDALRGFMFRKGFDYKCFMEKDDLEDGQSLVVFDADKGYVGIGTEDPTAKLHVHDDDKNSGSFQVNFKYSNPTLSVLNLRPDDTQTPNYLAIGADDDKAVLSTDSTEGFVFMQGNDYDGSHQDIEIARGTDMLALQSDGTKAADAFSAMMNGRVRSRGFYVEPIPKATRPQNYKDIPFKALDIIKGLEPKQFKAADEDREQLGFFYDNVYNCLSLLGRDFPDKKEGVAYHNLMVVLVKAMKEMEHENHALKERVKKLEDRGKDYRD